MGLASRMLRVRAGEGRLAASLVGLMFVSMAAIVIGESAIDALFFDRIGTDVLPQMYLLQGAATFVAMLGLTWVLGRIGGRRAYVLAPLTLGAIVLAERIVLIADVRWIYPVMWVTVAIATLIQGVFLWGTAGAVVDIRQAKRLFPIFAAGGILGSVAGGVLTRPLAAAIGAENLLLVWAGALGVAFVLCRASLGPAQARAHGHVRREHVSALKEMAQGFAFVRRSRLLVSMTAAAVLFSVLYWSLYLPYARAASDHFPDADRLAGFFGLFGAGVTGFAFLVSMLLTNRLFGWFGVATMVLVLPVLYAGAFGILLLGSGFVTLVALRFAVGAWLQGVASPGWETLINVVPETRRDQTRAFLNGGPTQVGTIIAGVVALLGRDVLTPRQFAVIGLVAAALTIDRDGGHPQVLRGRAGGRAARRTAAGVRPRVRARDPGPARRRCRNDTGARRVDAIAGRPHSAARVRVGRGPATGGTTARARGRARRRRPARPARHGARDRPRDRIVARGAARHDRRPGRRPSRRRRPRGSSASSRTRDRRLGCASSSAPTTPRPAGWRSSNSRSHRPSGRRPSRRRWSPTRPATSAPSRWSGWPTPLPAMRWTWPSPGCGTRTRSSGSRRDARSATRTVEAVEHVLSAFEDPRNGRRRDRGGPTRAPRPWGRSRPPVRRDRRSRARCAIEELVAAIPSDGDDVALLRDAVLDRGRTVARSALWAATMVAPRRGGHGRGDRASRQHRPGSSRTRSRRSRRPGTPLVHPLLGLWERVDAPTGAVDGDWLAQGPHRR